MLAVACKEAIRDFGGNLDAGDAQNETPAHTCARYGNQGALAYLFVKAPKSFEVLNQENQKPADIAKEEQNGAQTFFSQLEEQKKQMDAMDEVSKANKRLLDFVTDCKDCFTWVARKTCNYQKLVGL